MKGTEVGEVKVLNQDKTGLKAMQQCSSIVMRPEVVTLQPSELDADQKDTKS